MSPPSTGRLYPASSDASELRRAVQEQARAQELSLQTHMATADRMTKLETADKEREKAIDGINEKLAALRLDIAVAEAKVKATLTTLSVVWTGLAFVISILVAFAMKMLTEK